MNKEKFLSELEYLLMDLSEEEREEAVSYYRDYFDEAGPEREREILQEIGSPEKVAAELKSALAGDTQGGEFSERGYRDERFVEDEKMPDHYTEIVVGEVVKEEQSKGAKRCKDRNAERNSERRNRGLLLILFLVFGIPVCGTLISAGCSVIFGVFAGVLGIFGGLFGLLIGGIATVFALAIGGIGMIVAGVLNLSTPALGIMAIGIGFLMLAAASLLGAAVKWGCGTVIPGLIRFCVGLVRKFCRWVKKITRKLLGRCQCGSV